MYLSIGVCVCVIRLSVCLSAVIGVSICAHVYGCVSVSLSHVDVCSCACAMSKRARVYKEEGRQGEAGHERVESYRRESKKTAGEEEQKQVSRERRQRRQRERSDHICRV